MRGDPIARDEATHQAASSLASEHIAKDHDLTSRPISAAQGQNSGVFAMQSEDFPALPGSQTHQTVLFSETDPIEVTKNIYLDKNSYVFLLMVDHLGKYNALCGT